MFHNIIFLGPWEWKEKYVHLPSNVHRSMVYTITLGIADSRLSYKHQNNSIGKRYIQHTTAVTNRRCVQL
jgi:hypothetical protein